VHSSREAVLKTKVNRKCARQAQKLSVIVPPMQREKGIYCALGQIVGK
jgi:hypothetical protein